MANKFSSLFRKTRRSLSAKEIVDRVAQAEGVSGMGFLLQDGIFSTFLKQDDIQGLDLAMAQFFKLKESAPFTKSIIASLLTAMASDDALFIQFDELYSDFLKNRKTYR